MLWGVQYKPTGGPFKGVSVALMETYGLPLLYRDIVSAREQAAKLRLPGGKPAPEAVTRRLVKQVVEYFSGHLILVGEGRSRKFVVNPGEPPHRLMDRYKTYEELKHLFKPEPPRKIGGKKKVKLRLRVSR